MRHGAQGPPKAVQSSQNQVKMCTKAAFSGRRAPSGVARGTEQEERVAGTSGFCWSEKARPQAGDMDLSESHFQG